MSSTRAKRGFDIIVAGLGTVAAAPLMAAAAAAVRLDSPGPVLYRQERVGRGGELFRIRKFRTMRTDLAGGAITVGNDPRITRVGHVLRKTKIDELPQLLDVVQGTMSLVGPRPEVPAYVALWPERERQIILELRPGITDPASIEFRGEAGLLARQEDPDQYYREVVLPRKVALYVQYANERSLRRDVAIILRTLGALFR